MAARFGLALLLLLALVPGSAHAQQLARLHVQSFTLSSDTMRPKVDTPFNVTLTIRVRENVAGPFVNVILPTFAGADELGDERVVSHSASGTVYSETLRLQSHAPGPLFIGAAYLDAIDARDGKPKRFISNELHLTVVGAGPELSVWASLLALLRGMFELLLAAAAVFVIVTMFRRRRPQLQPLPETPPPAAVQPALSQDDALRMELSALSTKRDRAAVLRVRNALWNTLGAGDGETLADVLRRPAAQAPRKRRFLLLVERAAFIEDARLSQAIDDVLSEREGSIA